MYYELLTLLAESINIVGKEKVQKLIENSVENMSYDQIFNCFEKFGMEKYKSLLGDDLVRFEVKNRNEKLLEALKCKGIIDDYDEVCIGDADYYEVGGKSN